MKFSHSFYNKSLVQLSLSNKSMASLQLPPSPATAAAYSYSSATLPSSFPFSPKTVPKISFNGTRNHPYKLSCKTTNSHDHHPNGETYPASKFDRRNLLLGLGGLYSGAAANQINFDNTANKTKRNKGEVANATEILTATSSANSPITLDGVVKLMVKRPKKSRSKKEKEEEEEVLEVDGIELERDAFAKFDVFVNEEDEGASGLDKMNVAGSFVNVPHMNMKSRNSIKVKTCLRLGISELLEDLGAEDDESVLVSLVPRAGIGIVTIGDVRIKLLE